METVKFGLIGKEDLRLGTGTFKAILADGREVTLSQINVPDLYNSISPPGTFNDFISKSPWLDVRAYGAIGDNSTDDTASIQSAITAAIPLGATVYFPPKTFKITSTLNITNAGAGMKLLMPQGAILSSSVGVGNFAITMTNCLRCNLNVHIVSVSGNGILVTNTVAGNSELNTITGTLVGPGKNAAKVSLGTGSVGIEFATPVNSNYYNHVRNPVIQSYDTLIRLNSGANGNLITYPKLSQYWFGVDFNSTENSWIGGFLFSAAGTDASHLSEGFHIRALIQYNFIAGMAFETGAFSEVCTCEATSTQNIIKIIDNSTYGISDLGTNNIESQFKTITSNKFIYKDSNLQVLHAFGDVA